jgi:PKD repeat protein
VAFAWVAGASRDELQVAVAQARQWYENYQETPELLTTEFVCTDSTVTIQLGETYRFYQDALGSSFLTESDQFTTGAITQDTAIYAASLENGYEGRIQQISIEIQEPVVTFSVVNTLNPGWQNDTLFLDETNNHLLTFQDDSQHAVAWWWDFGNGYRSTQQHPQTSYFQPGTYKVALTVASEPGCTATYSREITVVQRAVLPLISNRLICGGSSTTLQATNTTELIVYADEELTHLLHQGGQYTTEAIDQNTTFYVVNTEGEFNSQPLPVLVEIWQPSLEISYSLDTTDLSTKYSLAIELTGETNNISQYHWYVNNSLVSQQPGFTHDFSDFVDEDWYLRLDYSVDSADLNCTYSLEKTISRTQSPKPDLSARHICRGEPVTLAPTNGNLFYFYQDADLTVPLHVGKTLMLDSVAMNTIIYVTNLDGLIESEATAVAVKINRFADFKTLADTVYLSEPDMAVLQAFALEENDPEISWQWDLGDGNFNYQSARVVPQFDSAGVYPIRLLATRSDGCTNLISKTVVVRNVASVQLDPEDQALKVYPNPVQDVFYLENLMWFQKDITISLLSLEGQVVLHKQLFYREFPLPIYLSQLTQPLPPGVYVLRLQRDDKVFQRKLMLE